MMINSARAVRGEVSLPNRSPGRTMIYIHTTSCRTKHTVQFQQCPTTLGFTVMSLHGEYAAEAAKKYEYYNAYKKCQSKAFVSAMGSLVGSGALILSCQLFMRRFYYISPKSLVALPAIGSTAVAYLVARNRTHDCQRMWMAMEGKYSDFSASSDNGT